MDFATLYGEDVRIPPTPPRAAYPQHRERKCMFMLEEYTDFYSEPNSQNFKVNM